LIHYPVLKLIKSLGIPLSLQFVTSCVLISLMAWFSYKYFEQPANKLIRGKLTKAPVAPAGAGGQAGHKLPELMR
jgi:peptidoglycan/LPS O-acetylase OafA/YrhL